MFALCSYRTNLLFTSACRHRVLTHFYFIFFSFSLEMLTFLISDEGGTGLSTETLSGKNEGET